MSWLEEQVNFITSQQHEITSRIGDQAHHVYNTLEEFKNEQSWISGITMEIDKHDIRDSEVYATFNWQVKELKKESDVVFHYALGGSKDYIAVPAEEVQNGFFQVKVPFIFDKEPQWHVGHSTSEAYHSESVSEEAFIDGEYQDAIEFYITVSYDDVVKSSNTQMEYLGELKTSYYGIIQTDVHVFKSKVDITLINYQVGGNAAYVEKAYLLKYKNNTLIGEEELQMADENPPEYGERFFHLNQIDKYEDIRLVIKVTYSNGETFEKEVY